MHILVSRKLRGFSILLQRDARVYGKFPVVGVRIPVDGKREEGQASGKNSEI